MQCHSSAMLTGETVPAHADEKSSCLSCHFGHGGDSAIMLRPGASAQSPPPESELKEVEKQQPIFNPESGRSPSVPPAEERVGPPVGPEDDEVIPAETPNPS